MTHHHTDDYYYNSTGSPSSSTHYVESEGTSLSSQFHAAILDNEFLLRAALTHDWDTLTSFCQFLEEIFTLSVPDRRQQWQRNRITAAKQQLVSRDQWGNTALHAACYNLAPARVVRALLQAASACRPTPLQIHQVLSRDHSTPLLVACATGASLQVIEALLDPPAGLIKAGATVMIPDQQGATPLTELAVNYELQRKSPMHVHTSRPLDQVQLIRYNNNNGNGANGGGAGGERADTLLDSFQAKLEALLQAAWSYSFPSQSMISMVHGLAHVAASCPPVITRLVLREYPHMIGFTDRRGTLPLHIAISNLPPPTSTRGTTIDDNDQQHQQTKNITAALSRHSYCVEQLLHSYPSSASFAVPYSSSSSKPARTQKKRSPFLQAIASGCFWHTSPGGGGSGGRSTTTMMAARSTTNNNNNKRGPLHFLWQANPEDLSRIDPVTGFYPVILAAIRGDSSRSSKYPLIIVNDKSTQVEIQEHILQVDTIYNLLRLHPQVLEECRNC